MLSGKLANLSSLMSQNQLEVLIVHIEDQNSKTNKSNQVRHLQEVYLHQEMKETHTVIVDMGIAPATKVALRTPPRTVQRGTFLSLKIATSKLIAYSPFSSAKTTILSARLTPKSRH